MFQTYRSLSYPEGPAGVSIPAIWGESDDCFYELFTKVSQTRTLAGLIAESAPLHPSVALEHLANIAAALDGLHSRGIFHADLKPDNVLMRGAEGNLTLIDFGMARPISDKDALIVGTWAYMHPALRVSHAESKTTSAERSAGLVAEIGPYIDIYAAALICFEMLAGGPLPGRYSSRSDLAKGLRDFNPWMRSADPTLTHHAAGLLWQMINTPAGPDAISAHIVSVTAHSLARDFEHVAAAGVDEARQPTATQESSLVSQIVTKLDERLEALREELLHATATFIAEAGELRDVDAAERGETLERELGIVFGNALQRTRISWWVGISMTVICFGVMVAMVATAVILSVRSGVSKWSVMFGAGSVVTVLGTLLWKPYDRAFQATIIAQQIENIHVKTATGFRCTSDFEKRMLLFDSAQAELNKLLTAHASVGHGTIHSRLRSIKKGLGQK